MRVLIIAFYFPPDPEIGAVRPGALRDYLAGLGHDVETISAARRDLPDGAGGAIRPSWRDTRTFAKIGSSAVARSSSGVINEIGAPDEVGRPAVQTPPWRKALRGGWRRVIIPGSPLRRIQKSLRSNVFDVPDSAVGWIRPALLEGHALIDRWRPDVIVATGPPFSAFLVAWRLASRSRVPWCADYRDLWTSSEYYDKGSIRHFVDSRLERRVVRSASLVTTVSGPLAQDLEPFGVEPQIVMNGADPYSPTSIGERTPLSDSRLNLLYVGSEFYEGRRSPEVLFEAAKRLGLSAKDLRFHFLGTGSGPTARTLGELVDKHGVWDLVEIHPRVSREECLSMQTRVDALLLLLWNDPREAGTFSGKIYEYIAARRPILMVGYPAGVAADLIRTWNLGLVVSDLETATQALTLLVNSKESARGLLEDLPPLASRELSREAQLAAWTARLEGVSSRSHVSDLPAEG